MTMAGINTMPRSSVVNWDFVQEHKQQLVSLRLEKVLANPFGWEMSDALETRRIFKSSTTHKHIAVRTLQAFLFS